MNQTTSDIPYWSRHVSELIIQLKTEQQGLSEEEAKNRLDLYGPNVIREQVQSSILGLLLRQFENPLVLILVFGALISMFLHNLIESVIILIIVLGSALLGFFQEYRASAAISELRRRLALTTQVVRGGVCLRIPASMIVPGDMVVLTAGNLVPADGLVIEARDFLVTEASLTGESFPVEKHAGVLAADTPMSRRTNSVFLGTSVRSGTAKVLVVNTGRDTAFASIAARLDVLEEETEFARGVRQFGYLLVRVMVVMVIFVLVINQFLHRPLIESLMYAVALAVGISPELLPAIVSVTLSHGARAMARRGVIVRHLEAIENLGSMDVLCTDKTGTLTEGVIDLNATTDPDGVESALVRRIAFLNAALETGIENPLDVAIMTAGSREGLTTQGWRKIDEIPYDFVRKRLTIVATREEDCTHHLIVTKGAFAAVLDCCTALARNSADTPLGDAERLGLETFFRQKSEEGYRVLALATRRVSAKARYDRADEREMTFTGFLLFFDPPKAEADKTITNLARLGIRIKIITGDNRYVAAHVASNIGLNPNAMLTGSEIGRLRDEALWHKAETTELFVEVDPQQKERIVRALQRTGHAVGYMGDGINDAPALHAADVGISVQGAVDVARETADVVLLQSDLDVLRNGVEDGRRTFANTLKYICITTSANFGNMVSMALATPLLPFLPLVAKQILLNNFLSDLPSVTISTDNVDPGIASRSQRWQVSGVQRFMIVFGLLSTLFDMLTFAVLLVFFKVNEPTFQSAWFVESLLTELAVLLVLRTKGPALRSKPSRLLFWSVVAVGLLAIAVPYLGSVSAVFGFVALPSHLMSTMILIVLAYVMTTEAVKIRFFRTV